MAAKFFNYKVFDEFFEGTTRWGGGVMELVKKIEVTK